MVMLFFPHLMQRHYRAWALTENNPVLHAGKVALGAAFQENTVLRTKLMGSLYLFRCERTEKQVLCVLRPAERQGQFEGFEVMQTAWWALLHFFWPKIPEAITSSAETTCADCLQLHFQLGDWDRTVKTGRWCHCKPTTWCSHIWNYLYSMFWILHNMLRPLFYCCFFSPPLFSVVQVMSLILFLGQLLRAMLLPPCSQSYLFLSSQLLTVSFILVL